MHIGTYVGGCIAVDEPKDKYDVSFRLTAALGRTDSSSQI